MLLLLGFGCLINQDLYDERLAALRAGDSAPDTEDDTAPDTDTDPVDDADGDGFVSTATGGDDCDDADATVHPDATETPYDGVDQDCSGADLTDVDGDGADGGTGGPDCDDGAAGVFPGAEETWENGFTDNDCDGEVEPAEAVFGSATWYGPIAGAWSGANLAALGDLDGDGAAEWAVAGVYDASLHDRGGAVYVGSGAEGGPLSAQQAISSGGANWYTGTALRAADDLDGDGAAELLIGATGADSGTGAAFVLSSALLGAAGGLVLPDAARTVFTGEEAGTYAGSQVAAVGDLDGDGVTEIAVSAPFQAVDGLVAAGRVYVLPSDLEGNVAVSDASWTWDGYFENGALGNVVEPAGDQDGDGLPDVLLSMQTGVTAWIVGGTSGGAVADLALAAVYNPDALPVTDVGMVGDLDGDGTPDLVIHDDYAAVYLDLVGTPSRILGEDEYSRLAIADGSKVYDVADLGDRDGDGRAELMLGVPALASEGTGWLGVVPGSAWRRGDTLTLADLTLTATSIRSDAWAGYRVRALGDVDGDGKDDVGIGAPSDDEGGLDAGGLVVLPVPQ